MNQLKVILAIFMLTINISSAVIYVSPGGTESASGTISSPKSLTTAITTIAAGDTIYVRTGMYSFTTQIAIDRENCGTTGKLKCIFAYKDEKPVFDFSKEEYTTSTATNQRGLQINGHFWHVKGITVTRAADNGIFIAGNNNIIESCITHKNRDSGLQIARMLSSSAKSEWPSNNLILNCESYDNNDEAPLGGENADGFACKLTSGPGNVFRGCWAHNNIDDGWDLYTKSETGAISPVVLDLCIASNNGTLTDGTVNKDGDKNGFKLGGEKIDVAHYFSRCVAFNNGKNGFTWNSNPGAIEVTNCLAFDNAEGNYKFGESSTPSKAIFTNNISFWTSVSSDKADKYGVDVQNSNCWWNSAKSEPSISGKGLVVTAADFSSNLSTVKVKRNPDNSLDMSPFGLATGSDLLNAGVIPTGTLPFTPASYYKGVPDLGPFEQGSLSGVVLSIQKNNAVSVYTVNKSFLKMSSNFDSPVSISISDLSGRIVKSKNIGSDKIPVMELTGIASGTYLFNVSAGKKVINSNIFTVN